MLRVGITADSFIQWGGGLDFLRTVVSSLQATSVPLQLHFLVPGIGSRSALMRIEQRLRRAVRTMVQRQAITSHAPSQADLRRALASCDAPIQLHDIDIGASALFRKARHLSLDVLLPSFSPLPFGRELPWLGYLYDFQHRHLPQFFTAKECRQRDHAFQSMLEQARGLIVNAQEVASDIARFYPDAQARVFALPFSAAPAPVWLDVDGEPVRIRYGIPPQYFIICNQFWQHKDHATAFKAFAKFARHTDHDHIDLVCTGATSDYRSANYFSDLIELLRNEQLGSRVHILGLIPKDDQIALLKGAVALLQPTLNEGGPGGGAVYDAVSLGVPTIASDIPVNLEIIGETLVSFFRAGDTHTLAHAMQLCVSAGSHCRPTAIELLEQGRLRRLRCGNVLLAAIESVRR